MYCFWSLTDEKPASPWWCWLHRPSANALLTSCVCLPCGLPERESTKLLIVWVMLPEWNCAIESVCVLLHLRISLLRLIEYNTPKIGTFFWPFEPCIVHKCYPCERSSPRSGVNGDNPLLTVTGNRSIGYTDRYIPNTPCAPRMPYMRICRSVGVIEKGVNVRTYAMHCVIGCDSYSWCK